MAAAVVMAVEPRHHLGGSVPGPLDVLTGRPLLAWAVDMLDRSGRVGDIVVVVAPAARADIEAALATHLPGHAARFLSHTGTDHAGLHAALDLLGSAEQVVLHEASRPLAPASLLDRVLDVLAAGPSPVVPVTDVTETVRAVDTHGWAGETVARESLRRLQTPAAAHPNDLACLRGTCDAADGVVRAFAGPQPTTVAGDPRADALLHDSDLAVASHFGGEPNGS